MLTLLRDKLTNAAKNASALLQWSIDHPKLSCLLALNYIVLPILARNIQHVYWQLDCGTFEIDLTNWQGKRPTGLFFHNDNLCFAPEAVRDIMLCYLGGLEAFDQLPTGEDTLKMVLLDNKELTFCDQFNKLRPKF